MKFLCVCEGGNVRSVSLAFALKYPYGMEALACGWRSACQETLAMLCQWADRIIVMQPNFAEKLPPGFEEKVRCVDVGPDRFGNPFHPELLPFLQKTVQDWFEQGWKI
jgi:predicted protein tyrosine phosphatase